MAQTSPGAVSVTVHDSQTGNAIENAEVFLIGSSTQSSLTAKNGTVTFEDLAPGIYRIRVKLADYKDTEITEFEVLESQRVAVRVALASSLHLIGSVTAHSAVEISRAGIDENSAIRRFSDTFSDALSKLAGVTIDNTGNNTDAFNVSLRNHDPSQTRSTVDGVPMPAQAMSAAGQDLFTGASVDFTPSANALGGSINYRTLSPTKTAQYKLSSSLGNYGNSFYSLSATGSSGKLGYALQDYRRYSNDYLDGLYFADQSGLFYAHEGYTNSQGDLVKLRYALSTKTTLESTTTSSSLHAADICSDFTTLLPCGSGPGNGRAQSTLSENARLTTLMGNLASDAGIFFGATRINGDYTHRFINGVLSPFSSSLEFKWGGAYFSISATARRHTLTSGGSYYASSSQGTQLVAGYSAYPASLNRSTNFFATDRIKSNSKLTLAHTLSFASDSLTGGALALSEAATWQPDTADTVQANATIGASQPYYYQEPFNDPASGIYDCHNGSVYLNGPNDRPARQSQTSYNLTAQHKLRHGSVTASLYRQNLMGVSTDLSVPIGSIDPGALPPDYVQGIEAQWSLPGVCGATPFSTAHVYIHQSVSNLVQRLQGMSLEAQLSLGRNVILLPNYTIASTAFVTLDPRLKDSGSYYSVGT